jgi:hypothetical protein
MLRHLTPQQGHLFVARQIRFQVALFITQAGQQHNRLAEDANLGVATHVIGPVGFVVQALANGLRLFQPFGRLRKVVSARRNLAESVVSVSEASLGITEYDALRVWERRVSIGVPAQVANHGFVELQGLIQVGNGRGRA